MERLTVERAHAVRGRGLLQSLLDLLSPLGFVLQSLLEFPLGLLLLLQTLLNDCWDGGGGGTTVTISITVF